MQRGCKRLTDILRPQLGESVARQCASRITQALVYGCGDPVNTAWQRLTQLGPEARRSAATRVASAWLEVNALR
jgi:hypothetical protein